MYFSLCNLILLLILSSWALVLARHSVRLAIHVHVLMRDEKERRKKQTNNKAKQHRTPEAVTFPKKNELPQVGLEPTTLYTLDRALYHVATCTCKCLPPPSPSSTSHLLLPPPYWEKGGLRVLGPETSPTLAGLEFQLLEVGGGRVMASLVGRPEEGGGREMLPPGATAPGTDSPLNTSEEITLSHSMIHVY